MITKKAVNIVNIITKTIANQLQQNQITNQQHAI